MKTSTKIILAVAFVSTLGFSGLARTVDATQSRSHIAQDNFPATIVSRAPQQGAEASNGDRETNDDKQEEESAQLQSLAKISSQQAQQAAERTIGGKASRVELESENGNLVYAVEIGQQEVKVDAGNGRVLYTENANQENNNNEASRPKSSIQVPQTNNGERGVNDGEAQ